MTRLPHGFPAPWFTADTGGASDLQTDVMRFMAILALCLVAIFALVQAVPMDQPPVVAPPRPEAPVREVPPPVTRVAPVAEPVTVEPAKPLPAGEALPAAAPPAAVPAPAAMPSADDGFTLRFESDVALKSLVARGEVGLYAMQDSDARRLRLESGRPVFWQASMPSTFHEMEAATVPADIAAAVGRVDGRAVRWGVTLPPRLLRDIDARIGSGGSGELVIAANGTLRRE